MKIKCISRANMPVSLPIWEMVISRIALDHFHFSPGWYTAWWWVWGISCALCLVLAMLQEQTNIFRGRL